MRARRPVEWDGKVERVLTEHGSHIMPELDTSWPALTQLQWKAAVTEVDAALPAGTITVVPSRYWINGVRQHGLFDIMTPRTSGGAFTLASGWEFLNGVVTGARLARLATGPSPATSNRFSDKD